MRVVGEEIALGIGAASFWSVSGERYSGKPDGLPERPDQLTVDSLQLTMLKIENKNGQNLNSTRLFYLSIETCQ